MMGLILFVIPPVLIGLILEFVRNRNLKGWKDLLKQSKLFYLATLLYAIFLELYFLKTDSMFRTSVSKTQLVVEILVGSIIFFVFALIGTILGVSIKRIVSSFFKNKNSQSQIQ